VSLPIANDLPAIRSAEKDDEAPAAGRVRTGRPGTLVVRRGGCVSVYSSIIAPEPPYSFGKSFSLGNPSFMGSTVSA
jgi:hypothetical protein